MSWMQYIAEWCPKPFPNEEPMLCEWRADCKIKAQSIKFGVYRGMFDSIL